MATKKTVAEKKKSLKEEMKKPVSYKVSAEIVAMAKAGNAELDEYKKAAGSADKALDAAIKAHNVFYKATEKKVEAVKNKFWTAVCKELKVPRGTDMEWDNKKGAVIIR